METGQIINVNEYSGSDFKRLFECDSWCVAFLRHSERFSEFRVLERHNESAEVFVLLSGSATLYARIGFNSETEVIKMEELKVYCVPKGVWHHIVVSENATVLVAENSNTSKENTEKREI